MRLYRVFFCGIAIVSLAACDGQANRVPATEPATSNGSAAAKPETGAMGPDLVPFASDVSMQRLARAAEKVDFFKLSNNYEGQQNLGMCGPTSAVIVLNTLLADRGAESRPTDPSLFPAEFAAGLPPDLEPVFHRYSQGIFFQDKRVTDVKKRETFYGQPKADGTRDPGMQLRQLHKIFLALGVRSEIHVVDDTVSVDSVRQLLRQNLGQADDYVVVNYHRPVLHQKGGGHISPLGAYDDASDSFLILDVNPNGKTWAWVRTEALVAAMRTFDSIENRGFLLVKN